ncbi:MAG: Ig-like domain-containing protein [Clostridia bacterium]|nr:Ig-like domain-containing protein [Clostridia bacterium]MBQ8924828.1 Ig-like domain-containing protein [Clostridia bacterium]
MQEKTFTTKRNSAIAIVMALLMTAVMPIVVLADTALTISSPRSANSTIYTGDSFTLTVSDPDFSNSTTNHIDWTSSDTSVATISKHNGVVTVLSAGSVTFTATVKDGAKPSGGSGGTSCTTSTGYETASISFTVATSTSYGYQGTGGNTMYMTALNGSSITSITAGILYDTAGTTVVGYNNTINAPTAAAGTVSFGFMMSAGTNNFSYTNFNTNCVDHITIQYYDDEDETYTSYCGINDLTSSSFNSTTGVITISSSSVLVAGTYKITFGANVCGNNTSKKLGVPVSFIFDVVSSS